MHRVEVKANVEITLYRSHHRSRLGRVHRVAHRIVVTTSSHEARGGGDTPLGRDDEERGQSEFGCILHHFTTGTRLTPTHSVSAWIVSPEVGRNE